MPWLRLWTDILDNPDLHELSDATCWGWTLMLAAAKRNDMDGALPSIKTLAHWMRKPRNTVLGWIDELKEVGLLEERKGTVYVHGWERWQSYKDWTNAERQARHKAKKKALSALSKEKEEKEEREGERNEKTVTSNGGNAVTTPLPPVTAPSPPPSLRSADTPEDRRAIEIATARWGASSGDSVVGDLLRTYEPGLVLEAMDQHFDKHKYNLKPALLRGACEGKFSEGWKPKKPPPRVNQPMNVQDVPDEFKRKGEENLKKYGHLIRKAPPVNVNGQHKAPDKV